MSQLTSLWHYLNSSPNFVPSVVGIAAAFAGSWGAQIAILRREQRRETIAKLNAVNEAQALCFTITSTFMAMKNQHVTKMMERFRAVEKSYEAFQEEKAKAAMAYGVTYPLVFTFEMDLHTLPVVKVPIDRLEVTVFEKIALSTQPLVLTVEIAKAISALNNAIETRNDILSKWYDEHQLDQNAILYRYLGVKLANRADEKYKKVLHAIKDYCDDCIFFSVRLSIALADYGKQLRRKNRHHIFWRMPRIAESDYTSEQAKALIPPEKKYEKWLSGFKSRPTLGQRIKGFFRPKQKKVISPGNR